METFKVSKEKMEVLIDKAKIVGDIAMDAAMKQIGDQKTITLALGVGLIQGLKYNGSLKRGIKAGLATMGVVAGANVVMNIAKNWDVIKND